MCGLFANLLKREREVLDFSRFVFMSLACALSVPPLAQSKCNIHTILNGFAAAGQWSIHRQYAGTIAMGLKDCNDRVAGK